MQWFALKPNLLGLIEQILGVPGQILDLDFSFSLRIGYWQGTGQDTCEA